MEEKTLDSKLPAVFIMSWLLRRVPPWNQRCLLSGETGLPVCGDDYHSNLSIWTVPMALEGMSVKEFAYSGLVKDTLSAAGGSRHSPAE
jgi:hypothetical protein